MSIFVPYLKTWQLEPDGIPIQTHSSHLLPVKYGEIPAMLKIALHAEEERGATIMEFWNGRGAARVFKREGEALLMERAMGKSSLRKMVRQGHDDEASRILCAVAAQLHETRLQPTSHGEPLSLWFRDLAPAAARFGGLLTLCALTARQLLQSPQEVRILHGDLHHDNVLDFGERGWLAIDPKGLVGERGFDFANLFCNPDLETATAPGRLRQQIEVVSEAAQLDRKRLLQWVLAWSGLSAVWMLQDDTDAVLPLQVARLAADELGL
jgi:streptomycin 6-kinase